MTAPVIPFADIVADWSPIKQDALSRIARIFDHGQFIMGPEVAELEDRLAAEINVSHAISCSSGTTALQIALMALDVRPGDEVILPAFTFAAPLECVLLLGATPVLADIDPHTCLIDLDAVAALIGPKTRAMIGVSLYGRPVDFTPLQPLVARREIAIIEDAAQSFGASLHGKSSGGLTMIGCTSFFPTKPLGAAGDGGALFTDDSTVAQRSREIRDHGQCGKYNHVRLGINGRLDSIACAALLARLGTTRQTIAQRQAVARRYDVLFQGAARRGQLLLQPVLEDGESACAQYVVQVERREDVIQDMLQAGIQVAVHYPKALHQQPAYRDRVSFTTLANAELVARRALCLPIYPTLTEAQQERVASTLVAILDRLAR